MTSRTETLEDLENRYQDNPASLAFARLAESYLDGGDEARAVSLCIDGLKRYPNYATARLVLGRCFLKQGRVEEAATEFRRVCRVDRRCPIALKMLADTLVQQRRNDIAGSIYAYLLENDPDNTELRSLSDTTPGHVPFDVLQVALATQSSSASGTTTPAVSAPPPPAAPSARPQPQQAATPAAAPKVDEDVINLDSLTPPGGTRLGPVGGPTKAPATQSAEDLKTYANLIESAETISMNPSAVGGRSSDVTGQDIFSRIDTMFGEDEQTVQGPDDKPDNPATDALTALFASGQMQSGTLDTGRFSMKDIPSDQFQPIELGGTAVDSSGGDAFGATMAFESPLLADAMGAQDIAAQPGAQQTPKAASAPLTSGGTAAAGPSGADVSSRLDEIFDHDLTADEAWPTAQAQPAAQPPLVGFASHTIDTAMSPDAALAGDATAQFGAQTVPFAEDTSQTAMFETDDVGKTAAFLEDTSQTAMFATDAVVEQPSAPAEAPDQTAMFASEAPEQQTAQFEIAPPDAPSTPVTDEHLTAMFASPADALDALFGPPDQGVPIALDQEMSFGNDQQQAVEDVMTAAFEVPHPKPPVDDQTGIFEQPDMGDTAQVEALGETQPQTERTPVQSSNDDDIFADTWMGSTEVDTAQTKEPETLQQQTDKAQTLAFARDELDDMIAIEEDSREIDRRGDTTTIRSLTSLTDETEGIDQATDILRDTSLQTTARAAPQPQSGFQEINFDDTAQMSNAQTVQFGKPIDRTVPAQTTRLTEDLLAARTTQLDRSLLPPQQQAPNTIESYAQEISQAQTLLFRRQDLDRLAGNSRQQASAEEQAELDSQISQAHTVEFNRDDLSKLGSFKPPQAPSEDLSLTTTARIEDTLGMVDTSEVFLDETLLAAPPTPPPEPTGETLATVAFDTVVLRPADLARPPKPAAPARMDPFMAETIGEQQFAPPARPAARPVPPSPRRVTPATAPVDPFLAETISEQPVRAPEPQPTKPAAPPPSQAPRSPAPIADTFVGMPEDLIVQAPPARLAKPEPPPVDLDETVMAQLPDTIVMRPDEVLPNSDLVWEEEPATQIELVVRDRGGKPELFVGKREPLGDMEDTVEMDRDVLRLRKLLEHTEQLEPEAPKPAAAKPVPPPAQTIVRPVAPPPPPPAPPKAAAEVAAPAPAARPAPAQPAAESTEPGSFEQAASQLASIPDHVLTPTLADIYYHQGQPHLAIQIYKRLLQLQPENSRLTTRIAQIESDLASTPRPNLPQTAAAAAPTAALPPSAPRPAPLPTRRRSKLALSDKTPATPLRGTKLKREVRERHRRKNSRRS